MIEWIEQHYPDGSNYIIRIVANYSGEIYLEDISDGTFTIENIILTCSISSPKIPTIPTSVIILTMSAIILISSFFAIIQIRRYWRKF